MSIEKINAFITLCEETKMVSFSTDSYKLPDTFLTEVVKSGIPYEQYPSILKLQLKLHFKDYEVQYSELMNSPLEPYLNGKEVLLISISGCCTYDPISNSFTTYGVIEENVKKEFVNATAYFTFFNFLKNQPVSDYFNDANCEIIFYNSANGIIKVKFDPRPVVNFTGEISEQLKSIQTLASSSEIHAFFVNAIYQLSEGTGQINFEKLVKERNTLIDITKRDYQLYTKKFDFETFRDSLYEEKEKYFKDIRELVDKIFGQMIGIPISIAASVFTTYKVQGNNLVIGLVLLSFISYLVFYLRLQWVYKNNLDDVLAQFELDFNIIEQQSGLPSGTIDAEKLKVKKKITSAQNIQLWLIGLIMALGILVSCFMLSQFFLKDPKDDGLDVSIKALTTSINNLSRSKSVNFDNTKGKNHSMNISPETFLITVEYNERTYHVNVQRISLAGRANEYWCTISNPANVLNRFPAVKYIVNNNKLLYTDSLKDIFPGFAEKQKEVLAKEIQTKKWRF